MSPKTSPHSSLQAKKFATWNLLWENPRLSFSGILCKCWPLQMRPVGWFHKPPTHIPTTCWPTLCSDGIWAVPLGAGIQSAKAWHIQRYIQTTSRWYEHPLCGSRELRQNTATAFVTSPKFVATSSPTCITSCKRGCYKETRVASENFNSFVLAGSAAKFICQELSCLKRH